MKNMPEKNQADGNSSSIFNPANWELPIEAVEQNMHHFMTNSPWPSSDFIKQVQNEIKETPELWKGGVLSLDESAGEGSTMGAWEK